MEVKSTTSFQVDQQTEKCSFGVATPDREWVLYWCECLDIISLWELTCMHCMCLALWTGKVFCGSFYAPYVNVHPFTTLCDWMNVKIWLLTNPHTVPFFHSGPHAVSRHTSLQPWPQRHTDRWAVVGNARPGRAERPRGRHPRWIVGGCGCRCDPVQSGSEAAAVSGPCLHQKNQGGRVWRGHRDHWEWVS